MKTNHIVKTTTAVILIIIRIIIIFRITTEEAELCTETTYIVNEYNAANKFCFQYAKCATDVGDTTSLEQFKSSLSPKDFAFFKMKSMEKQKKHDCLYNYIREEMISRLVYQIFAILVCFAAILIQRELLAKTLLMCVSFFEFDEYLFLLWYIYLPIVLFLIIGDVILVCLIETDFGYMLEIIHSFYMGFKRAIRA
jgi:hypothetical protein